MANSAECPEITGEMLAAVRGRIAELHQSYYGRRPGSIRAEQLDDDVIACLFGDVYTNVEKTLIETAQEALVHENRTTFQKVMEDRFIGTVETITGRSVAKFFSTHHVDPDLELELFVLGPALET